MVTKFFLITCQRGHAGIKRHTEIAFAIKAPNLLAACKIAKKMPSVKHSKGVINATEITESEYRERIKISAYARANGQA